MAFHAGNIPVLGSLVCKRLLGMNLVAGIAAKVVAVGVFPGGNTDSTQQDKSQSDNRERNEYIPCSQMHDHASPH
jgi:hypothetical protein